VTLTIAGKQFERVLVVDDQQITRDSFSEYIEELSIEPIQEAGPLPGADEFADEVRGDVQGVLCDHHLKKKGNYAAYNGDELVESLYKHRIPAILSFAK
jgi:CheY-like chemotaxis protein